MEKSNDVSDFLIGKISDAVFYRLIVFKTASQRAAWLSCS
jgi:hypothetical protein